MGRHNSRYIGFLRRRFLFSKCFYLVNESRKSPQKDYARKITYVVGRLLDGEREVTEIVTIGHNVEYHISYSLSNKILRPTIENMTNSFQIGYY